MINTTKNSTLKCFLPQSGRGGLGGNCSKIIFCVDLLHNRMQDKMFSGEIILHEFSLKKKIIFSRNANFAQKFSQKLSNLKKKIITIIK